MYLLLCQLLFEHLAVDYGHGLDILLPLFGICDPVDEPVVALPIVAQLPAQLIQLALPQVDLSEDSAPAVLQAAQEMPIVIQLGVPLAVNLKHALADRRGLGQLTLHVIKHGPLGFCLRTHSLNTSEQVDFITNLM